MVAPMAVASKPKALSHGAGRSDIPASAAVAVVAAPATPATVIQNSEVR